MAAITKQKFGEAPDGRTVEIYTLANDTGVQARIMTYGGTLVSLRTPDRSGIPADVVLGFNELAPYLAAHPYFGSLIGRYANRIAGACFSIDGKSYPLSANDGRNHLHGGTIGFDKRFWDAEPRLSFDGPQLALSYLSHDGEEGYPGNLIANVIYTLTAKSELRLDYSASTDRDTVVNLTNHSYFNLAGSGTIHNHSLCLAAKHYLPVNREIIPLGEQRAVGGTPFDFTSARSIGSGMATEHPQLQLARGYDHCWVLDEHSESCPPAAELYDPASGRLLTIFTTQPGIQFYSGNLLDGSIRGKGGQCYHRHSALCLETQDFPDSPNQAAFPSTLLRPAGSYRHRTVYRFGVRR